MGKNTPSKTDGVVGKKRGLDHHFSDGEVVRRTPARKTKGGKKVQMLSSDEDGDDEVENWPTEKEDGELGNDDDEQTVDGFDEV